MTDYTRGAPLLKIPELDGVRGIAILLVIIFHFNGFEPKHPSISESLYMVLTRLGWAGVDLFFVLSGFLITRILLDTKHLPHYFKSFYLRRVLRILPVYYLVIFLFFDCALPFAHRFFPSAPIGNSSLYPGGWEQLWYWLHLSNWQSAFGVYSVSPIGHFWSLAVEEQFYFVWPLVILLCDESSLLTVCIGLILVSDGLRYIPAFQAIQTVHIEFIYRLTPFRIEPLLFGAILAILERRQLIKMIGRNWRRLFLAVGCIGVATAILLARSARYSSWPMSTFGLTAIAIISSSVVLYGIRNTGSALWGARILRSSMLARCGKYSYAMYIFQGIIMYALPREAIADHFQYLDGFAGSLLLILIGIGLSYLAARCSWALIEQRCLRLKLRFPAG